MTTPDITLYTYGTQNGERGNNMNLGYFKINPNGKIPTIVDHSKEDFSVFESTAIAIYLCENYDPEEKLLPKNDPKLRSQVIQWVMFETSGIAPRARTIQLLL
ncbi:unnamed protein product [Rhizophagus irregularis]|nr:unnamed protein product [Rhizophagus irregularis]